MAQKNVHLIFTMSDGTTNKVTVPGIVGSDGKSAYDVAVDNGFEGTETEWLESLRWSEGNKEDVVKEVIAAIPVYEGEIVDSTEEYDGEIVVS